MKIKVGVMFGGNSVEHEVSIITAIQAINSFDSEKYDIVPIYIAKDGNMYCGEDVGKIEAYKDIKALISRSVRILPSGENGRMALLRQPPKKFGSNVYDTVDVAFPAVHGTNVEDGTLQGYLHTLGVPFAGCDVLSSAVGMDKYVMKAVLKDNGLPVLPCVRFDVKRWHRRRAELITELEEKLGYPIIIKPVNLGSSVGIKIARDREGLIEAVDYAFDFAMTVLAEKAIVNLREINCSVLGDYETAEASECEEPVNTDEILSYEDKYGGGGKSAGGSKGMSGLKRLLPAPITPQFLRGAKNKEAAWELMKFAVQKNIQLTEAERQKELLFPSNKLAANDSAFLALNKPNRIFVDLLEHSKTPTIVPLAHDVFWREYMGAQERVVHKIQSPVEALKQAEKTIQMHLDETIEYDNYVRSKVSIN